MAVSLKQFYCFFHGLCKFMISRKLKMGLNILSTVEVIMVLSESLQGFPKGLYDLIKPGGGQFLFTANAYPLHGILQLLIFYTGFKGSLKYSANSIILPSGSLVAMYLQKPGASDIFVLKIIPLEVSFLMSCSIFPVLKIN